MSYKFLLFSMEILLVHSKSTTAVLSEKKHILLLSGCVSCFSHFGDSSNSFPNCYKKLLYSCCILLPDTIELSRIMPHWSCPASEVH